MAQLMHRYLDEIGAVPLLTATEERSLSQTIQQGRKARARLDAGETSSQLRRCAAHGERAKATFVRANLRLVVSIARHYPCPPSHDVLDLVQEGNLGLLRAVERFDWRRGVRFSTYGTFWIRQAIGRALDQQRDLIRLPRSRSSSLRAALREAAVDGRALDEQHALLYQLATPTSLDRPTRDQGAPIADLHASSALTPEEALVDREADEMLQGRLAVLPARNRAAVEQRFGLADGRPHTYPEIGAQLGISSEAARRLVARAVGTLRRCERRAA